MSDLNMPGTRKVCRIQFRFDNGTLTFTYMLLSEYKKKSTSTKELVTTNAQECSKSKATQNRFPLVEQTKRKRKQMDLFSLTQKP